MTDTPEETEHELLKGYALVVVIPKRENEPDRQQLASKEFESLDEAANAIAQLDEGFPGWQAVTIVHIEDYPKMMEDATHHGTFGDE